MDKLTTTRAFLPPPDRREDETVGRGMTLPVSFRRLCLSAATLLCSCVEPNGAPVLAPSNSPQRLIELPDAGGA